MYWKSTQTNRYLNYQSNHQTSVKPGNIPSLYNRAKNISWVSEFKKVRAISSVTWRSGRPVEITTTEMFEKLHKILIENLRLKECEIAETTGVSTESVSNLLHQHFFMQKLCSRWVQKLHRKTVSTTNLALYKQNPSNFLNKFQTEDKNWVQYYIPGSKQQSKIRLGSH